MIPFTVFGRLRANGRIRRTYGLAYNRTGWPINRPEGLPERSGGGPVGLLYLEQYSQRTLPYYTDTNNTSVVVLARI